MGKRAVKIHKQPQAPQEVSVDWIQKALGPKCACYVLITCTEPSEKGEMQVELNFEGDETLAAFLVENASLAFHERISRHGLQ